MADYRLPMDADGVKYHGTVDQNEENPGHFMYGLDENGNKRIIRTDKQGNVLTRLTGSKVEYVELNNRSIRTENAGVHFIRTPKGAKQVLIYLDVHGVTGNVESGGAYLYITPRTDNNFSVGFILSSKVNESGRGLIMSLGKGTTHLTDVATLPRYEYVDMSLPTLFGVELRIDGDFSSSEGIDCETYLEWYF